MSQAEPLPDDIEACHALIRRSLAIEEQQDQTNDKLARDNERLRLEIEQLKRYIYGRRSERHVENDSQLNLFDDSSEAKAEPDIDDELLEEEITYRRRRRSKSDRFPENLPRQVKTIGCWRSAMPCRNCVVIS